MTRSSNKETLDRLVALSEQLGDKEETDEDYSALANQFNAVLADLLLHCQHFRPNKYSSSKKRPAKEYKVRNRENYMPVFTTLIAISTAS